MFEVNRVLIFPWNLWENSQNYVFTWLIGYSALLGPIAGILITDYFFIRGTELNVPDLFRKEGQYTYVKGWNPIAMAALVLAVLPNIPGFLHALGVAEPEEPGFFDSIYPYAWFVGFFIASLVYGVGMKVKEK
jgi:NCS1 family nucleobase:cation symporter-1